MMSPDEQIFRSHIEDGKFASGQDRERWRLVSIDWPYVFIAVSAASRPNAPTDYVLRFHCGNYPQQAPTAQPWDIECGTPLPAERWPGGRSRVPSVFRPDWQSGQCLYLPCDRISINGHANWANQHPHLIWTVSADITLYLEAVHELLNSRDYTGVRGT
jgi:hypothetical protein